MKKVLKVSLLMSIMICISCMGEVSDKLKKAKNKVSNAGSIVENAKTMGERMGKLKEMEPTSNDDLKAWLPENLDGMERTKFRVGGSGVANVSSVEGTYKQKGTKTSLNARIMDGAGEAGSVLAMGFGMFGDMEMEMEDERKHQQTVEVDGIRAQQTYYKKNSRTNLMFVYEERFMVTIDATDMDVDETWKMVEKLDLEGLVD